MPELHTVNRNAIVLEPTQAYWAWAKTCPGCNTEMVSPESDEEGGTVYLIPEQVADPWEWVKRNYKAMFEFEFNAWYTDEACWPKDRSYDSFRKFFKIGFHSVVIDMGNGVVDRDGD